MILKGLKLVSNIGKLYAVGKTVYTVVDVGLKLRKGAKVVNDVKKGGSKMMRVVKGIGTATEVAATTTQVVTSIASDAKDIKDGLTKSKTKTKVNKDRIESKKIDNPNKKKNR